MRRLDGTRTGQETGRNAGGEEVWNDQNSDGGEVWTERRRIRRLDRTQMLRPKTPINKQTNRTQMGRNTDGKKSEIKQIGQNSENNIDRTEDWT